MTTLRHLALPFVLALCTALAACGGGGKGGAGSSQVAAAPAAPTGLVATAGNASVGLSWAAVSGATSYSVFMGTSAGGQSGTAVASGLTTPSAGIGGLTNGVTYYFVVRAVNASGSSAASNEASATPTAPAPSSALEIARLDVAQTHVLPADGLGWTLPNASERLHLAGRRESLALVRLSAGNAANPRLEGWRNGVLLGTVALSPPSALPPTEAQGAAFAGDRHSAALPADWLQPGLQLRALADNYLAGGFRAPRIGADFAMTVRVLPFYVYGANESNSKPLSETRLPPAAKASEVFAKWPVSSLLLQSHAAGTVVWPTMVIGPRDGQPAYVARNSEEQRDGYATMSAVLNVLGRLLAANGESPAAVQYYAPLMMHNAAGRYVSPGGGLGGGSVGTGDHLYGGVFIHEQGHAFGLPHVGDAHREGRYPYPGGSLAGSTWGYDSTRREFLAPSVPATAERAAGCQADVFMGGAAPRQLDAQKRCVKQDPMQEGSGDQAQGYAFATFSDYSAAVMQRYLEGVTTVDGSGRRDYDGGKLARDASFPGGYKRWDTLDARWVNVDAVTTSNGIFGLNRGLPVQREVPVYSILLTLSNAGTAGVTQIYPPLGYIGNLLQYIDPTDAAQRASIVPDTSTYPWYCRSGGCDYTLRVTYSDNSRRHVLVQGGFRPWNQPTGTPEATTTNPLNGNSYRVFGINVPADKPLRLVELLHTPAAWNGLPANPGVLASRTVTGAVVPTCVEPATLAVPASAAPAPKCG